MHDTMKREREREAGRERRVGGKEFSLFSNRYNHGRDEAVPIDLGGLNIEFTIKAPLRIDNNVCRSVMLDYASALIDSGWKNMHPL